MRSVNVLRVLLVTASLCGVVQFAAGQSSAKAEVLAALVELDKAFVAGDETKLGQLKSQDYLQTSVTGKVQDKETWFKEYFAPLALMLKSGQTRVTTFERSDLVVREFGDTVVVAGKLLYKYEGVDPWEPNATFQVGPPAVIRFTQVWIKRGGAWKLAALHNATPKERK